MPSITCLHTLYKNTNINTKVVSKIPSLTCVHTLYNNTNINTKDHSKITILTCVHTLYNNTNINTKACFQNSQSYMCTYPLQQHKYKHKVSLQKFPVLHVYIPSTKTQAQTQRIVTKTTSLTCVNTHYNKTKINTKTHLKLSSLTCVYTFYNNTSINTKGSFQNFQSYMCP